MWLCHEHDNACQYSDGYRLGFNFWRSFAKCPYSLRIVDLRTLQFVRVIHIHGFPRGVEINRAEAFAMPLPVCLTPPKGKWTSAPMVEH